MARKRIGNPHQEIHNDASMVVIDWFAPAGTDVRALAATLEAAVPGLKLHVPAGATLPYQVNGFVSTSTRADGSVYVSVSLFGNSYSDNPRIPIVAAPTLNPGQQNQMVMAVGEDPGSRRQLKGGNAADKAKDAENLTDAGFGDNDAPMKNT